MRVSPSKWPKTHWTSFFTLNHQYVRIVNTQIPPVGGKPGQQICSSWEQIMSRKHTKAPYLENRFKRREKKPQTQHYKTKCYSLPLLCMCIVNSSSSSIGISIELLSFGVKFKWIHVNKFHGLSQSHTSSHPFRKWAKQNDQQTTCRGVEFKNIHSNMNMSINTVCWREKEKQLLIFYAVL